MLYLCESIVVAFYKKVVKMLQCGLIYCNFAVFVCTLAY